MPLGVGGVGELGQAEMRREVAIGQGLRRLDRRLLQQLDGSRGQAGIVLGEIEAAVGLAG
jgi:hypothetical protein